MRKNRIFCAQRQGDVSTHPESCENEALEGNYESAKPDAFPHASFFMTIKEDIRALAKKFANELKRNIDERVVEMEKDDRSHVLIYRVLGISQAEGRFLYKYAGSFLEDATKLCFKQKFPDSAPKRVENTRGKKPKLFGIDCLVDKDALEIKWRDATTDGDHITKEHTRMQAVHDAGNRPVRVMFYYPNREQAIRIQQALESLYRSVGGHYVYGDAAWQYVKDRTQVDLRAILEELANEKEKNG